MGQRRAALLLQMRLCPGARLRDCGFGHHRVGALRSLVIGRLQRTGTPASPTGIG